MMFIGYCEVFVFIGISRDGFCKLNFFVCYVLKMFVVFKISELGIKF